MIKTEVFTNEDYYLNDIIKNLLPDNIKLSPGTYEIFELELAVCEYNSLTEDGLIKRGAYFKSVNGRYTNHYILCANSNEAIHDKKSIRAKSFFRANRFSTGYATHSLFPYRGKFHPQLIKAIMNLIKIPENGLLLDPVAGSGTAPLEAQLIGINSIGIDVSPFCKLMGEAKSKALTINLNAFANLLEYHNELLNFLLKKNGKEKFIEKSKGKKWRNSATDDEIGNLYDIILLAFLDAVGYTRRQSFKTLKELFPEVLRRYFYTIESFHKVQKKLNLKFGNLTYKVGSVCDLPLTSESVDGIITSPPYSFAIDYVENDRPQLEYLGIDVLELKKQMLGLVGKGKKEKIRIYFEQMEKAIAEMYRVLKPGKFCVIIVGSNDIQTGGIRIEDELIKLGIKAGFTPIRKMPKSIKGIQNSMTEEYILFLQKPDKSCKEREEG